MRIKFNQQLEEEANPVFDFFEKVDQLITDIKQLIRNCWDQVNTRKEFISKVNDLLEELK
jgi:hypothetical protein